MGEWMLEWLVISAESLVSQAPGVAAELLAEAVSGIPTGRSGTAGSPAGSLTRFTAQVTAQRLNESPNVRSATPLMLTWWWICTGRWLSVE